MEAIFHLVHKGDGFKEEGKKEKRGEGLKTSPAAVEAKKR